MSALMIMSWCHGSRCDPCKPPTQGEPLLVLTSSSYAWNWCLAGDPYQVAFYGSSTGPGTIPVGANPDFPLAGYSPATPDSDPLVKYQVSYGDVQSLPVTVDGVQAGTISGGSGFNSDTPDPGVRPYPPPCPNNGQVQLDVQALPPPVDPNYPSAWIWIETLVSYAFGISYVSVPGGIVPLNSAYNDLYAHYGKTDPLLLPGGPQFTIHFQ